MKCNHFYTFLLKYENGVNLRNIPMTQLKQSMIDTSMNSVALFIKELPYSGFDEGVLVKIDGNWVCKNSELYAQYLAWCIKNSQKSFKDNIFHKNIPKHMFVKKGKGREPLKVGKQTEYIRFNYTQIDFNFEIDDNGKFILDNVEIDDVDKKTGDT